MAKGGSNSEAIALQKESLKQSALQAKRMEELMQQSIEQAKNMKLPAFAGPSPLPQPGSADAMENALSIRRNLLRRSGLSKTVYAGG
jgi:hypothetical protein